jgi:hypothetical protein
MRLKWKLILVHLEIELILTQERCTVCTKHTIGSEIIMDAPDGTPRWCGSCGISFRSVWRQCLCWCKIRAWFAPNIPWAQKSFWTRPRVLIGDETQVEARFGSFEDSVMSVQDRCPVCAKHTIGSKIILDAPVGTPRWRCSSGSSFQFFWKQC